MPDKKKRTKKKKVGKDKRRIVRSKKTRAKKYSDKIKPETINKILSDIHILLSFPSIEFLPSTNIFAKNNTGHYIQMIDYQELGNIINNNIHYKKSPTIQKIFNYHSYQVEREEEIVFNYQNIKCDNLIIKEQKNYNVRLLFLYLLECNITDRLKDIIQLGGDGEYGFQNMINYDMNNKKNEFQVFEEKEKEQEKEQELERVRELEREKFNERQKLEEQQRLILEKNQAKKELEKSEQFENEIKIQNEKVNSNQVKQDITEEIKQEQSVLNEIIDKKEELEDEDYRHDVINIESREIDKSIKEKEDFERKMREEEKELREKVLRERGEMEKRIELKIRGFEEFLENKKVSNIAKNSFAIYNVNWFYVCCGLEKLDDTFEEEIQKQINDMGLILNEDEIKENLLQLFEDKRELNMFKKMMKNRLISCSEIDPPNFFEKLFTNSFGTFRNCDERSPQSLLYLYDDYRTFLEKDLFLSKLERVLLLIYCETRQHHFSKYISLEIIRKENDKQKKEKIISILDKIMKSDKSIIKENEKLLEQKLTLKYKDYKQQKLAEIKEQERIKTLVTDNNIIIQKNKLKDLQGEKDDLLEIRERESRNAPPNMIDKLFGLFEKNKTSPTFDLVLTPKERLAYEKVMNKMKGGANDNMITYETTLASKNEICNRIKGEKNIYLNQLHMVDNC